MLQPEKRIAECRRRIDEIGLNAQAPQGLPLEISPRLIPFCLASAATMTTRSNRRAPDRPASSCRVSSPLPSE
jgi:hypothetical protein